MAAPRAARGRRRTRAGSRSSGCAPGRTRPRCSRCTRECARTGRCRRGDPCGRHGRSPHALAAGPTSPISSQTSERNESGPLEAGHHRGTVPEQRVRDRRVFRRRLQARHHLKEEIVVQIERHTAGTQQRSTESVAARRRGQVQDVTPNAPAVGRGRQITDVPGQRPQVADVIRNPFELQGDAPDRHSAGGTLTPAIASTAWQ